MKRFNKINAGLFIIIALFVFCSKTQPPETWKPLVDWGHWRLGQKADLAFLQKNRMTVTFGSGAPNFESVTRAEFDRKIEAVRAFNKSYHDKGYIVLRYLATSLDGETATNKDIPQKNQIAMLKFYRERWADFSDLIGPKPKEDPTHWITIRPDCSFPFYRYARYGEETTGHFETWGCPDNPDYVRMMEGKIRAQAATGIDGSYVDWTQIAGGTCYCSYTRDNFIQYLKANLPPEVAREKYRMADYDNIELPRKRGDKFWMEWITFRCRTVAEFHKKLRTAAREVNPNFMISGNVFGGFGYGPIAYDAAGNMEMLGAEGYDDFIYSEIQEFLDSAPRKDENGTKITNSPALKFLAAASHGKPAIVYATEITPPIFPNPTEKCLSAMAQINIAEAVANHAIFREKRQTPPGATAFYQFLANNENYLLGAQLSANVAILTSLNQYLADELSFAFSASRVLADRGIAHVMIVEDDLLKPDLNRFDLILLPYLPLLSVQKQQALIRFVEQGGNLLILGESGSKNEYNVTLLQPPLAHMFGGEIYPRRPVTASVGQGKASFLPIVIPRQRFLIPPKNKTQATTFGPSMADVFPDIPEGYTRNRMDPQLRAVLESVADRIEKFPGVPVSRIVSKSPLVEFTTMTNPGKNLMLVHLVNYDVPLDGTIGPAKNVAVQVLLPPGKKIEALNYSGTLSQLKPVSFETGEAGNRQIVRFTVDQLNIYGLAVLKLKE